MLALLHVPSPRMNECVVSFVERQPIDLALVHQQHANYCRLLEECGATLTILRENSDYPDCVFIEDTAIVLDELAIIAALGAPSRRGEAAGVEATLREHRPIARIVPPAMLEGGDVLRVGKQLLVGVTTRSNARGIEALAALAPGYTVIPVRVRGCLHLKSACSALPDGRLLISKDYLDLEPLAGFGLLDAPPQEPGAANIVVCGGRICMPSAHARTAELLSQQGFEVHSTDLSEFAKAEGSATCLSILIP